MKEKNKLLRKVLSFVLALAMVMGNLAGTGFAAYAEEQVPSNGVSYYTFDDAENVTKDAWGTRDGILAESATTADGKSGQALSVTTAGEGMTFADDPTDYDNANWTITYWVKTTADFVNNGEISVTEDAEQHYSTSLRMGVNTNNAGFRVGSNNGQHLSYTQASFTKDTWYHLAWVQNKTSGGLTLYVNGQNKGSSSWTVSNTVKAPIDVIGGTGFTGLIDEVKIFNTALSAAEVAAEMRVEGEVVPSGTMISEMFAGEVADISWVFTGGADVKGGFEQTRGERNYAAMFEKYDRGGSSGSFSVNRQRFVVNAGKAGQTLSDIVATYDTRIATYAPKAAVYLVGSDDWKKGDEGLTQFQTDLESFIEKSLDLREGDQGFAVIQKPFAVNNVTDNALIEKYCTAVDGVVANYAEAAEKYARIVVIDHYTSTKDDTEFLTNGIDENGRLTADGHFMIGRQFTTAVSGCTESTFNSENAVAAKTEAAMPEQYLNVMPTVTAGADSLNVVIPEGNGNAWKYELDMDGVIVSGTANANSFVINGLAAGKAYVLKIQSADGGKQLTTVKGTITADSVAVKNVLADSEKNQYQKEIAEKIAGKEPLTWLFMGDSITHATTTAGYDGVVQVVEDYVANELGRTDDLVVNAGVNNATTEHTLEQIQYRLVNYKPDILAIQLGTNDAIYFDDLSDGATGAAMGLGYESGVVNKGYADKFVKYTTEMQQIINKAKEINPSVTIILRSPTPSLDGRHVNNREIKLYVDLMKQLAETNDCMFIDQYTELQGEVDTYSWMRSMNNSFFFTDTLHPGTNGHRIMAQWFIKACGLWTEDSAITNLMYEMSFTEESNTTEVEIGYSEDKIAVSAETLEEISGQQLGHVVLTATADGQSYQVTASDSEDYAVLENLPGNKEYTVSIEAYAKASAKKVTFATQTVTLSDDSDPVIDVVVENTVAEEITVGTVVSDISAGVLAPDGEYTYTLCEGDGDTHNEYFEIVNGQLVVKQKMERGRTYQIRIKVALGSYVAEKAVEITVAKVEIPTSAMTPTAGSSELSQAQEGPEKALDNNNSTLWHAAYANTDASNLWYQIELDSVYEVDGFRYQPRLSGTNGLITSYQILTSVDGSTWNEAASGEWEADNTLKVVDFDRVEAKYVKLVAVSTRSNAGKAFASAAEIRLTGTVSTGTGQPPVEVPETPATEEERAPLSAAIKEAQNVEENKYTAESYAALQTVITAAQRVFDDPNATTEDVNAALKAITDAKTALKEIEKPHEHTWNDGVTKTEATVFDKEVKTYTCTVCKASEDREVGEKLAPTIETNAAKDKITLQKKQTAKGFEITDLAKGDSIVSITSSNKKVVKVKKVNKAKGTCVLKAGKLTGKKGKATITITLASGLKKTIKVTVQKAKVKTTKVTVLTKKITLTKGQKQTLKPVLVPFTSQDQVKFTTSSKKVVTVTSKGKIKAKKKGKATITVKAGKKKVKVKVTVK